MANPTKILFWSVDEAQERVEKALEIMDRLDVDPLHWDTIFGAVMLLLSGATLQMEQQVPLTLPRNLRG